MFNGVILFSEYVDNRKDYIDKKTGETVSGRTVNTGMIEYIATREGVELNDQNNFEFDASAQYIKPSLKQKDLIKQIIEDYPEVKKFKSYEDYLKQPSLLSASKFITESTDVLSELMIDESNEIYLNYIGTRPNVEMNDGRQHGLFSSEEVDLDSYKQEIREHDGIVWRHIISLSRDQAIDTEFDNQASWKTLLNAESLRIAKEMNISAENLRWAAGFHNEGHHPHVHMMIWSKDPKEGYLDKKGIEQIRSALTNSIFDYRLDLIHDVQNDDHKEILNMFKEIRKDQRLISELKEPLLDLARAIPNKGRMYYGYMPADVKEKVDAIVKQILESDSFSPLFNTYLQMQEKVYQYYKLNYEADMKAYKERLLSPQKGDKTSWHNQILELAVLFKEISQGPNDLPFSYEEHSEEKIDDIFLDKEREKFIKEEQTKSWFALKNAFEPLVIQLYKEVRNKPDSSGLAGDLLRIHITEDKNIKDKRITTLAEKILEQIPDSDKLVQNYVAARMLNEKLTQDQNNQLEETIAERVKNFLKTEDSKSLKNIISYAAYNFFVYKKKLEQSGITPLNTTAYFEQIRNANFSLPVYNEQLDHQIPYYLLEGKKHYFTDQNYTYANSSQIQKLVDQQNNDQIIEPTIKQLLELKKSVQLKDLCSPYDLAEKTRSIMEHHEERMKYAKSLGRLAYINGIKDIPAFLEKRVPMDKKTLEKIGKNIKNEATNLSKYDNSLLITRSDIGRIEKMTSIEYEKVDYVLKRYSEELENAILKNYDKLLLDEAGLPEEFRCLSQLINKRASEPYLNEQTEIIKKELLSTPEYNRILNKYIESKMTIEGLNKMLSAEEQEQYSRKLREDIIKEPVFNEILNNRIKEAARQYLINQNPSKEIDIERWYHLFQFATPMYWEIIDGELSETSLNMLCRYVKLEYIFSGNEDVMKQNIMGYMNYCRLDQETKEGYIEAALERVRKSEEKFIRYSNAFQFTEQDLYALKQDTGILKEIPSYRIYKCLFRLANMINREQQSNAQQAELYRRLINRDASRRRMLKSKEERERRERM